MLTFINPESYYSKLRRPGEGVLEEGSPTEFSSANGSQAPPEALVLSRNFYLDAAWNKGVEEPRMYRALAVDCLQIVVT